MLWDRPASLPVTQAALPTSWLESQWWQGKKAEFSLKVLTQLVGWPLQKWQVLQTSTHTLVHMHTKAHMHTHTHKHICSLIIKTIPFSLTKTWSWRQSRGPRQKAEPGSTELGEMRPLLFRGAEYFLTSMKDCYHRRQRCMCWISTKLFYLTGRWDW